MTVFVEQSLVLPGCAKTMRCGVPYCAVKLRNLRISNLLEVLLELAALVAKMSVLGHNKNLLRLVI